MIEPVIESLIQLLVQSILVYVVLGPSDSIEGIAGPDMADIPHSPISGFLKTAYGSDPKKSLSISINQK